MRGLLRVPALCASVLFAFGCSPTLAPPESPAKAVTAWPAFGGDLGGQRHADLDLIRADNVDRLAVAWTYRHGDVRGQGGAGETAFENTPVLVDGTLYVCTPFDRVIALDPATGAERWVFDPEIDTTVGYANQLVCRGVTVWDDPEASAGSACARSVFLGTNDGKLWALDAASGEPCKAFGGAGRGAVDLVPGVGELRWHGEYQVTSPPAVVGDVVVVGSAVSDNGRIDAPSGVVRGFDARTGRLRWAWDLAPPGFDHATGLVSEEGYALGTPNVWAPMSVDADRGLVFVPTGNAAPDYYRGDRHAMNHYGASVVALRGATGEVAWHFRTVHNDLWDFDVPAQPTLTDVEIGGVTRPALVQATKMGLLFVLDRETGEPLLPVEERPVPGGGAPGEHLSPTQPFPKTPILIRDDISPDDAWGVTPWDRGRCREEIERYRFDGMYTPPSVQGTIMFPGNAGGSNWGGIAADPARQLAFVRSTDIPWVVRLIPRDRFDAEREADPHHEYGPQKGTPFGLRRDLLLSPLGLPCIPPPWGTLSAVDLRTGDVRWQVPHGTVRDLAPVPLPLGWGVPGTGGPIATSSGLVFIAAAMDDYLRAFDAESGAELWRGRLPAGGQATPMSYRVDFEDGSARQYVVIAAGGHSRAGTKLGDHVVAFALEERSPASR